MVDRFLREVKRMHQLRQDINEMTPEEADDDAAEDWVFAARDAQLPPPDLSSPSFKGALARSSANHQLQSARCRRRRFDAGQYRRARPFHQSEFRTQYTRQPMPHHRW